MASIGKIYGYKDHGKVIRSVAAAKINGLQVEIVETQALKGDCKKPEFLAKFPMGKIPSFESSQGFTLIEGRAIARYIAGLSDNAKLLGTDAQSSAEVDQWCNFADEEIFNKAVTIFLTTSGMTPYIKTTETSGWENLNRSFKFLESHLNKQTFAVGHRLTLADLTLVGNLRMAFSRVCGPEFRDQYPNTMRYFNTIINQPTIVDIYGGGELASANAKYTPPPKETKAKVAAPAAAAGAAAAGAGAAAAGAGAAAKKADKKKKDDDDEEEEEKPAAPPAKHPCASLPPSPFVLDEAKRNYSNWETPDFVKWFYENVDKAGYSIWRFDFKYNEELSLVFMSSNQISGFFERLEASRKYIMGSGVVFGENNNSKIAGVIICRGTDYKPCLSVAPDLESYAVTPLDPFNKPEDKKFFEETLAWEGEVDGLKAAQGKFLK